MNVTLVIIGAAFVAAGLLGGTKLGGTAIRSTALKVLLVLVGIMSLLLGFLSDTLSKPGSPQAAPAVRPSGAAVSVNTVIPIQADETLWRGTLLLGTTGIDFDTDPPAAAGTAALADIVAGGASSTNVAKWGDSVTPTPAGCAATVDSQAATVIVAEYKARYCVRSNGHRRIALVTFVGQRDNAWEIEATVWSPRG